MSGVLLFVMFVSMVVFLFGAIADFVLMVTSNPVALKVFQALDYTMSVAGFVVVFFVFLWIANIIFGI